MWPDPQFPADLVTFTEEMLNGKHHFLVPTSIWKYAIWIVRVSQVNVFITQFDFYQNQYYNFNFTWDFYIGGKWYEIGVEIFHKQN